MCVWDNQWSCCVDSIVILCLLRGQILCLSKYNLTSTQDRYAHPSIDGISSR